MRLPLAPRSALAVALALWTSLPTLARANPQGGVVQGGDATIAGQGSPVVTIQQRSPQAMLSWQSFNIQRGEATHFVQPGPNAVAINRVLDSQISQIHGTLTGNGHVYLVNPHGILFGKDAVVDVNGLVAATSLRADQMIALRSGGFDPSAVSDPGARVENHGRIQTGSGGYVYLVAPHVENGPTGVIVAPGGEVQLAAGATVYLTDRPDGTGLALAYTAPAGPGASAVNLGRLVADGGLVRLRAQLVQQKGIVEATGVRERNGRIELYADDTLELGAGSVTAAKGGAGGEGAGSGGGTVYAYAGSEATVAEGARVDVSGGEDGGAGGSAEVSAAGHVTLSGDFRAAGRGGMANGTVLVDPDSVDVTGNQTVTGASVKITANKTLTLRDNAQVHLRDPQGASTYALHSGGDVFVGRNAKITDDGGAGATATDRWGVQIVAGATDLSPAGLGLGTNDLGQGSVYLSGTSAAAATSGSQAGNGEVSLTEGDLVVRSAQDVWIGNGGGLKNVRGRIDVDAKRDVRFSAGSQTTDGVIENGSGEIRVVAGRDVRLTGPGGAGNAAIRTRGVTTGSGATGTRTDGGRIVVWAKTGDVDAGVGNRWLQPGPRPANPTNPPDPSWDAMPVVSKGILGIGSEVGGDVTVVAGKSVRTNQIPGVVTGGSAAKNAGTGDYTGSHIGVFGRPVTTRARTDTNGPSVLPDPPASRLLVVAGEDVTGEYVMRQGRAVLRAGYALAPGVTDAGALDADAVASLRPGAAGSPLVRSAAASANPALGWFGTLARPVTVDLLEGRSIVDPLDAGRILRASVDVLAANGIGLRAIENPSLVYPRRATQTTSSHATPTYDAHDAARLEAETGDVVLIGGDVNMQLEGVQGAVDDLNVRILPPTLEVKTNPFQRDLEQRGGDLVLVNDFTLFPSDQGGLRLDVAGQVRTSNFAALGPAVLKYEARTSGASDLQSFTLPSGTVLRDPVTGIGYTLDAGLVLNRRLDAIPASGQILFRAAPAYASQAIAIPKGTRVADDQGRIYVVGQNEGILPPELRQSSGEVTFFAAGGVAASDVSIPPGTQLRASDGTIFETQANANLFRGQREVTVKVLAREAPGNLGRDARAFTIGLLDPIEGVASATNRRPTTRPAEARVDAFAEVPGAASDALTGRVRGLLDPIPGLEAIYNPAALTGGVDTAPFGLPTPGNFSVRATLDGPAGLAAVGHGLVVDDPSLLPPGVDPSEVRIEVLESPGQRTAVPVVFRALDVQRDPTGRIVSTRVDPEPGTLASKSGDQVWTRDGSSPSTLAKLAQSDADPALDARTGRLRVEYASYYAQCRSGAPCGLLNGISQTGAGPTHAADRTPAPLFAGGGFERVRFDLAEAAQLRTPSSVRSVGLATEHSSSADVSSIDVPTGDALFGATPVSLSQTLADGRTISVSIPDDARTGLQVSGPGSARVTAGVVPFAEADTDGSGFIERDEFFGPADVFDALDRDSLIPDGRLSPNEAPYLPTGKGGRIALQGRSSEGPVLGLQTVGNLQVASLPRGGAQLAVVAAQDVALGDRGFIGTLQGGDLTVSSVGGSLRGGVPPAGTTAKRGIVTANALPTSNGDDAAAPGGGGTIRASAHGDVDIGGMALAALSGSDIEIESRAGSVVAGSGSKFQNVKVRFDDTVGELTVNYEGSGVAAPGGNVRILARRNVDIGAGIFAGLGIKVDAGGSVLSSGSGALASGGSISVSAGQSVSGTIVSSGGNVSVSASSGTAGASVTSAGLATGVSSSSGPAAPPAETKLASAAAESDDAKRRLATSGAGKAGGKRTVLIDVTSRACADADCS